MNERLRELREKYGRSSPLIHNAEPRPASERGMPYYVVEHVEGSDGERSVRRVSRRKRVLMWAELVETPDGWELHYASDNSIPPAVRRVTRKPCFTPTGFLCEVEERGKVAMLKFTEYKGKRQCWNSTSGSAFKVEEN
jgi:hypothetical protein